MHAFIHMYNINYRWVQEWLSCFSDSWVKSWITLFSVLAGFCTPQPDRATRPIGENSPHLIHANRCASLIQLLALRVTSVLTLQTERRNTFLQYHHCHRATSVQPLLCNERVARHRGVTLWSDVRATTGTPQPACVIHASLRYSSGLQTLMQGWLQACSATTLCNPESHLCSLLQPFVQKSFRLRTLSCRSQVLIELECTKEK